jgi:cell division septum initiation protein DivIVA
MIHDNFKFKRLLFGGYSPREVDFKITELLRKSKDLEVQIGTLMNKHSGYDDKVRQLNEYTGLLEKALENEKQRPHTIPGTAYITDQAENQAAGIIGSAHLEASQIKENARQDAIALINEAKRDIELAEKNARDDAADIVVKAQLEADKIKQDATGMIAVTRLETDRLNRKAQEDAAAAQSIISDLKKAVATIQQNNSAAAESAGYVPPAQNNLYSSLNGLTDLYIK